MKAIWTEPMASYEGKYLKFDNAEIHPKPIQKPHPPVWVGGWMDQAAVRAGRYGEGWIPGWLSPKEMARGADILRKAAEDAGRDPAGIKIAVEKLACIARTRDEAMTLALPTIRESSHTYERDVDNIQFALDRHIIGSVDDVRRRIDEFIEAGVEHFELKLIYPDMDTMYKEMLLWSEEIIPHYV
jgi:alkanesulfonate monooxygenase SsuD/methylene tetrahydromethanopterin reductase-like flavin-dependent oxidoreductase (luciferase family)